MKLRNGKAYLQHLSVELRYWPIISSGAFSVIAGTSCRVWRSDSVRMEKRDFSPVVCSVSRGVSPGIARTLAVSDPHVMGCNGYITSSR